MAATKIKVIWKEVVQCNHLLVGKSLKINKSDSDKFEEFTVCRVTVLLKIVKFVSHHRFRVFQNTFLLLKFHSLINN